MEFLIIGLLIIIGILLYFNAKLYNIYCALEEIYFDMLSTKETNLNGETYTLVKKEDGEDIETL